MRLLQEEAYALCHKVFGSANASSLEVRAQRFLEEACELVQVCKLDEAMAHKIVSMVYSRPEGKLNREFGGVMMTLLCLAENCGRNLRVAFYQEMERIKHKFKLDPTHFRKRNAEKEELLK